MSLWPSRFATRIRFLRRCLKNRGVVERVLSNPAAGALVECLLDNPTAGGAVGRMLDDPAAGPLIASVLDDEPFFAECLRQRADLRSYFASGLQVRSLSLDLGTMLYDVEIDLLHALIERANSLPGPVIEIGTLFGYTTSRIALWSSPEKKIITVDNYCWNPWHLTPDVHHALTRRFLHYLEASGKVTVLRKEKGEFFSSYGGPPRACIPRRRPFVRSDESGYRLGARDRSENHFGPRLRGTLSGRCPSGGRSRWRRSPRRWRLGAEQRRFLGIAR